MDDFRSLANHFKREFAHIKISIRRVKTPHYTIGDCFKKPDGSFSIRIRKTTDSEAQQLALVHEMAHVLSWDTDMHPSEHGEMFGKAYAVAWRSYKRWTQCPSLIDMSKSQTA